MISFLDLQAVNGRWAEDIRKSLARVADSGWYLRGEETKSFEQAYASYIGTSHAISCANGLDALNLILQAYRMTGRLKEGDEVIFPANTFIASVLAITSNRLKAVPADVDEDTLELDESCLEKALTARTRAVMLVHLYGKSAFTKDIADFCHRHHLLLIEDNAQAHGCLARTQEGWRRTGSLGDAAGHSFYPGKNLGAMGDAGAVTTDDEELAALVRQLANYGFSEKYVCPFQGRNSRLDELQAAVLQVRLAHLDEDNAHRRRVAEVYRRQIVNPKVRIPVRTTDDDRDDVYHIFPVFCAERDRLKAYLREKGVETLIHYPIPPHLQQCYAGQLAPAGSLPVTERLASTELSLPMSPVLSLEDAAAVADLVNRF